MYKISIQDIDPPRINPRASSVEIKAIAAEVVAGLPDILVDPVPPGLRIINGGVRLRAQLQAFGSARVRVAGSGEDMIVVDAPDGQGMRAFSAASFAAVSRAARESRKSNDGVDPHVWSRYVLYRDECHKRDVRFLPLQVMRPIYSAAGF